MMKVGLTGGLGSGKSTVAKVFETLRIPVFYADDESKKITDTSKEVKDQLISAFGEELYKEGILNRGMLASIIFNDAEAIKKVNAIIHPAVAAAFKKWAEAQKSAYVLQEAAILFETGGYKRFDKNILVSAPEELRIERVMARSGWTKEEALQRMANQWGESQKISLADFVILNDGSKPLLPQILAIHENLIRTANQGG
jgi:dephospho-CoA kinase